MKEKSRAKALISEYFIFVIFIALVVVLTCLKPSFIATGIFSPRSITSRRSSAPRIPLVLYPK